jgi:hypothetical protein
LQALENMSVTCVIGLPDTKFPVDLLRENAAVPARYAKSMQKFGFEEIEEKSLIQRSDGR